MQSYKQFYQYLTPNITSKPKILSFRVDRNSTILNGAHYKMLADLEMSDSMNADIIVKDLDNVTLLLRNLIDVSNNYVGNRKTEDTNKLKTKTWIWRRKIDEIINNMQHLRTTSSVIICLPAIIEEYYRHDTKDGILWFAVRHNVDRKIERWLLQADAVFDENGFPTSRGAGKFIAKFGFSPVILASKVVSVIWQIGRAHV